MVGMAARGIGIPMLLSCNSISVKLKSVGFGRPLHGVAAFRATTDKKNKKKAKATSDIISAKVGLMKEKRRTRSNKDYNYDSIIQQSASAHVPVMLGEVLDVFSSSRSITSFVDCTLGAAGHSSAVSILFH